MTGHGRANPTDVKTKGKIDARCRVVLQRKGFLGKGMKWFTEQMQNPVFRKEHLADRANLVDQQKPPDSDGSTNKDVSMSLAPGSGPGASNLDDVHQNRTTFAEKGHYEVYTDENYAQYHNGRTWQQDNQKLVPKRMSNGVIKNLVYEWAGPSDRWTCSKADIDDIETRIGIVNSSFADDATIQAASETAQPSMLPDVFQRGMEDVEILEARPDEVLPPAAPPTTPAGPPAPEAYAPFSGLSASGPPPSSAPASAAQKPATTPIPNLPRPVHELRGMLGKKKRSTALTAEELEDAISKEKYDFHFFLMSFRENFFHKDVDTLLSDVKANHESLLKPANTARKIDEIIQLRDNMEVMVACKASVN